MARSATLTIKFIFTLLLANVLTGLAVRAQAPVVLTRQPARNAVAAPRSGPVALTFTQAIATASATNLKVFGSQLRGLRPGMMSGGGTTALSFAPAQAFAPGERVSVTVPTTITSVAGTAAVRQVYQFTAATGGAGQGFFLDTTEVAFTNSRDQLLGDIDNDGDLDLLTTGGLFGVFSFLNDGTGAFTANRNVVVGNTPSGAALADLNGDGYLDLLAGDADNATVGIALNNGNGIFGVSSLAGQLVTVGARPVSVATGDIDGDGDQDFVSANYDSNSASVRFNNGTGYFTGASAVSVGTHPSTVQLADIDNDGDLDLLTSNRGSNTVSIRLNSGSGTFSGSTSVTVGTEPSDLALADLDGDGDLDLLTTNASASTISLRLNNLGVFAGTTALALPAGSTPTGLSTGDVDADGDLDVVVALGDGGQVLTYRNSGSGSFTALYPPFALTTTTYGAPSALGIALGDVDNDGDLDLITSDGRRGRVVLGRNGLTPPALAPTLLGFTPGAGPVGTSVRLSGTELGPATEVRFNGIAAAFVVNSNVQLTATVPTGASTGPISVTTPGGAVTSAQNFVVTAGAVPAVLLTGTVPARFATAASPTAAVQATFASPIASLSASALRVFGTQRRGRQQGSVSGGGTNTLSLTPSPAFAPGERVSLVLPASLTGTSGGAVPAQVVEFQVATGGTGEGLFGAAPSTISVNSNYGLRGADLDNDGDLDLVGVAAPATTGGNATLTLRFNNGSGTFGAGAGTVPTLPGSVFDAAPADVDGDGDFDLLVTEQITTPSLTTYRVNSLLNNGQGQFVLASALTINISAYLPQDKLRVGDLDADGDLDFVYASDYYSSNSYPLIVALNNGTGTFALGNTPLNLGYTHQLRLGDLDNDGDLDVAAISNDQLITALNDGLGQFTRQPDMALGYPYSGDIQLVDFNQDGRLDAVINGETYSGSTPDAVLLWPGLGTGRFGAATQLGTVAKYTNLLALADVNADNRLDVIGMGSGGGSFVPSLSIRFGNSLGRLILPADVTLGVVGSQVTGGQTMDFDGDGDVDFLYTIANGATELRLNQGRPSPTITSLSPNQGPVGTRVVLTGTNFNSTRRITFGGVAATDWLVLSATQCTVVVPAGALTGPVVLSTAGGTATSPGNFTVTVPVLVSSRNPARNAVGAPRTTNVSVSFAQALTASAAPNIILNGSERQGRRSGTASGAGTATRSFDPTVDFAPGERVQVSVPGGTGMSSVQAQVYDFTAATGGPGQGNLRLDNFVAGYVSGLPREVRDITGDFDEDGAPDLLLYEDLDSRLTVLFNNGQGRFGARSQLVTNTSPLIRDLKTADINGDSHLDLLISQYYSQNSGVENDQLIWRAGTGTGSFGPEQVLHNLIGSVHHIAVGDLNGDGAVDLAAVSGTDSVLVSLNNGSSGFRRQASVLAVPGTDNLKLADIDNDGALDILTLGSGAVLGRSLGTGSGSFVPALPLALAGAGATFDVGDVNADGNLDLLASTASNGTQGGLWQYRGDGAGSFGPAQAVGGNITNALLRLADFDADGDLDLMFGTTSYYAGAQVLFNDGTGAFSAPASFGTSLVLREMVVADFNLDGSLDVGFSGDSVISSSNFTYKRGMFMFLNRPTAPTVSAFTPANGPVGTVVTLTGTGFTNATSVTIGGVAVAFTVVSGTQITITTTPGVATGVIVVGSPYGAGTSAGTFTVPAPTISSFTPTSGAVGRLVTITGTYFGGATAVRFNGLSAPGFVVNGGTEITVAVPAGATSGVLSVTTPSGTATSSASFTVVANPLLLSLNPARHAVAAAVAGAVGLTYSQPMAASSAAGLRVFGSQRQGRRAGTLSGDGTATLSFAPTQAFAAGEEVSVSLPAGVRDLNGNSVLAGQVYQFRAATSGSGRGTFVPDQQVARATAPQEVLLGDLNGDGYTDLLSREQAYLTGAPVTASLSLNDGTGHYGAAQALPLTNPACSQLLLADMDNDSDLDVLALDGGTASSVGLLLNNGSGQFAADTTLAAEYYAQAMTVGDVNADGNLDLLVSIGQPSATVLVWLGNGQGGFTAAPSVGLNIYSAQGLRLNDIDNDGDLDLLAYYSSTISPYYGSEVNVRLNDGRGQFSGTQNISFSGDGIGTIALADFDGDGDADMAVAELNNWHLSIRANDGTGQFNATLGDTYMLGTYSGGLAVGDVDSDGDLDLLLNHVSLTNRQVSSLVLNQGHGIFTAVAVPVAGNPDNVALADIDNDGDLDLIEPSGQAIAVLRNGLAGPELVVTARTPPRNSRAVAAAAPVGLVFSEPISPATATGWTVTSNQRQGRRAGSYSGGGTATLGFVPAQSFAPGEQVSITVPATLASASARAARPEVYQFVAAVGGTGTGTLAPPTAVPATLPSAQRVLATTTADVNGDGAADLLSLTFVSATASMLEVRLNRNTNRADFAPPTQLPLSAAGVLTVGDVDGDGDLDVVTAVGSSATQQSGRLLQVLANNGSGSFSVISTFIGAASHYALRLADFDADGDLDLVTSAYQACDIRYNSGQGNFDYIASQRIDQSQQDVYGVAVGDLDQDGALDLVFGEAYNGTVTLWYNYNNTPALTSPYSGRIIINPTASVQDVKVADFDGDGDLDLAVLNQDRNTFVSEALLYRNDGGVQQFTLAQHVPVDNNASKLEVGDLDHDGDPDLAVLNYATGLVNLRFNPGTLTQPFTVPTASPYAGAYPPGMALADLDGDQDLDLVATLGTAGLSLLLNGGSALGTHTASPPATPALRLYPNPAGAQGTVQVQAEIGPQAATVRLFNTLGQVVRTQELPAVAGGRAALPLAGVAAGTYLVRLRTASGQELSRPLVVE